MRAGRVYHDRRDILRSVINRGIPRVLWLVICLSPAASVPGCTPKSNARTKVAVSIFPIYDLARRVAGPDADVSLLLPPGRDEHHFDPTPKEVEEVAASRLGVMVGLGLDPWMEKLMKDAAPKARILKVGDRVPTLQVKDEPIGDEAAHAVIPEDDHDHEKGATDPHVWLDPARARIIAKVIGDELARADSAHATAYRQRASELDTTLEALDKETEATTKAWKTRGFITFHGSFGYFADRYHLQVVAVVEPSPGSAPTGQYVEQLLKVVSTKKVPAVFSEPQLDPRLAKTIADAAHVSLGVLDPVGGGPETDSYEKMIRFNVAALDRALK
jgi:zinc transport system substrate-binding protein